MIVQRVTVELVLDEDTSEPVVSVTTEPEDAPVLTTVGLLTMAIDTILHPSAETADTPCPECRDGKCDNCTGGAWDMEHDRPGVCPCWMAGHESGI